MPRAGLRRSSSGVGTPPQNEPLSESPRTDVTMTSRAAVHTGRSLEPSMAANVCMEKLLDKLKLLRYEVEFCRKRKPYREPLHRNFFVLPPSQDTSGQFTYFASLVTWLMQLLGQEIPMPKEFDDPNVVCTNMLTQLRAVGFSAPSFPVTKIHRGYGAEVCGILDSLASYVLETKGFTFSAPVFPPDEYEDEADVDDDAELPTVDLADEVREVDEEEEEEAYMAGVREEMQLTQKTQEIEDRQMLTSQVDAELWRLEVERVSSKLRITVGADSRDWRHHLEQAHNHYKSVSNIWPEGQQQLKKVENDVNASLEKLETREKFLNDCYSTQASEHKTKRMQLQQIQEEYNSKSESVSKQNNELHRIQEQLEEIKQIMDERGSSISDTSPVVRIRGAIKKLSEEIREMEVLMGIVSHSLLQLSLKDRGRIMSAISEGSEYYGL
ncbi:hypothetical protein BSKO_12730 [Bryopsis sp. KO-2023]|nr:hypothetical protein BSKO_12730 [Bryopsis sp. KO-2023]